MNSNSVKDKKIIISTIINIMIFVFSLLASIIMFTGFKFMHGYEPILEARSISMFKFFTVESNVFVGIVALIFAIKEIRVLTNKEVDIGKKLYILKLMATTAVGLTFLVVFTYLGPISKGGIPSMLMNSNLFFHLIIPVLSMINFAFFEKTEKLHFKDSFYGIVPTFLYEIYYLGNIIVHMENGMVSPKYDWYWFVQNGVWTAIIVAPMILLISFIISLVLWRINRK